MDSLVPNFNSLPLEIRDIAELFHSKFWTCSDIDLSQEKSSFHSLGELDQHLVLQIVVFLFHNHEVVSKKTVKSLQSLCNEIPSPELKYFFGYQEAIISVHYEMILNLIKAYIPSSATRTGLLVSLQTFFIGKKSWTEKWIGDISVSFSMRMIAFAATEKIFFSRCTALILWLKNQNQNFGPGLNKAFELICRDKKLNKDFVCLLFKHLTDKPSQLQVANFMLEAVRAEFKFFTDNFQIEEMSMDISSVLQHIEFEADTLMKELGYTKLWNTGNPFDVALEKNAFQSCVESFRSRSSFQAEVLAEASSSSERMNDQDPKEHIQKIADWQNVMLEEALNDGKIPLGEISALADNAGLSFNTTVHWLLEYNGIDADAETLKELADLPRF